MGSGMAKWTDEVSLPICRALAKTLLRERITRDGKPYLDRYFLGGWRPGRKPGPAVYLHHFLTSDTPGTFHSHPWSIGISLMLVGGYREFKKVEFGECKLNWYYPGDVNVIGSEHEHRIELLGGECWTLFITGNYEKPWKFSEIGT